MDIRRGNVVYVDLEPIKGSETGKTRPCLVIQNDVNNEYASTTIIALITSRRRLENKKKYPTHVWIDKGKSGLKEDSIIQCEQLRTVGKSRIIKKIGHLNGDFMQKVEEAARIILSMENY